MPFRSITVVFIVALFSHSAHAQARSGNSGPAGKIAFGGYNGDRETPHRTIVGQVLDKDGKPAVGAMVYLKDVAKSTTRIQSVDENGKYQFGPLPLTTDYEMWAQLANEKTQVKPISSFITTNLLSISLHFAGDTRAASPSSPEPKAPVVTRPN